MYFYLKSDGFGLVERFSDRCAHEGMPIQVLNFRRNQSNDSDISFYPVFQFVNGNLTQVAHPWWPGSGNQPPKENFCELDGSDCPPEPLPPIVIAGPTIAATLIIALVISISSRVYYVNIAKKKIIEQRERRDLIGDLSEFEALEPPPKQMKKAPSMSRQSVASNSSWIERKPAINFERGRVVQAKFRGKPCRVTMMAEKCDQVSPQVLNELKMIKRLRHFNVNPFIAISIIGDGQLCVVQELCPKGTLSQNLQRKRVQLDKVFKLSFAYDIAAGMAYIHDSPLKSHGNLNSNTILIDSRWNCRIGDFPLSFYNRNDTIDLWMAPELLRCEQRPPRGTQPGDVYAFGIILSEILTREFPFQSYCISTDGKFKPFF